MSDSRHHSRNGFLTSRGLREVAQQTSLEGLTDFERCVRVDIPVSVSGLVEVEGADWADDLLEDQYRRFLNGS